MAESKRVAATWLTEVVIVGGGPAGLMLAIELGRRGVPVVLLDQDDATAVNPQANATQARTMEHYRRLGFAAEVREAGLPADYPTDIAYYTRFSSHELARFELPSSAQAGSLARSSSGSWSAAELPHRVSQMFVERVLHRHAATCASVDLLYRHEVTGIDADGAGVRVRAVCDRGEVEVSGQFVVGADGARSLVRRHLGIGLHGESGVRRDFAGGDMHAVYLRSDDVYGAMCGERAWMNVNVDHERRCFLVAVNGRDEFVFHTQLKPGERPDAVTEADARRMFAQCMGRAVEFEIISRSSWTAGHALVADRFADGRVFLAGDAAHLFTPMGGLGYNTAIDDAVNLGWKLGAVVHGWGGDGLLGSYDAERRPAAERNTGYARVFAESLGSFVPDLELDADSPRGEHLRAEAGDYFDRHGRREFNIPGITFGTRYDGSPIIVPDDTTPPKDAANEYVPTACPGGRPPHSWLDDTTSLFDRFGPEFTILHLADDDDPTALEVAADELGIPATTMHVTDPDLRELYEAPIAIIRPDHVVAWRGSPSTDPAPIWQTITGR